jgi:hypothetical protein
MDALYLCGAFIVPVMWRLKKFYDRECDFTLGAIAANCILCHSDSSFRGTAPASEVIHDGLR